MRSIAIDQAFIGSCTNSRISDLRAAAEVLRGRRVSVPTIITPGSQAVRRQAEREGLHDIFQDAGALWTHSSCGPCLGMSMGVLAPGMRCVSSSNRNFPGRMGDGGRVHLAAPAVVAASRDPRPARVAIRSSSAGRGSGGGARGGAGMIVEGTVLPIPRANIDTDQIIPARYLTRIDADGMGEHCFEGHARRRGTARVASRRGDPRRPARTSAAARRASTRPGRSRAAAFAP